jgi:hypothetical protein
MRKILFIGITVVAGIAIIALMVKTVEKNAIQNQKMLAVKKAERKKRDSIKNTVVYDSAKIGALRSKFNMKVDKFDKDTTFVHRVVPKYINQNGIYPAFKLVNNRANGLYINIQYCAEDWLFIDKYQFLLDGESYDLLPFNVQRDNGDGKIWEWSSIHMDAGYIPFLEALKVSKKGKIRYVGKYSEVRDLSASQIKKLKEGYEYYTAMGGELK